MIVGDAKCIGTFLKNKMQIPSFSQSVSKDIRELAALIVTPGVSESPPKNNQAIKLKAMWIASTDTTTIISSKKLEPFFSILGFREPPMPLILVQLGLGDKIMMVWA